MKREHSLAGKRPHAALYAAAGLSLLLAPIISTASTPPQIQISPVPLTLVQPTHPQVLIEIGNSQSMDGDLSGAIMTGSGTTADSALERSSSPVDYTVPSGFTAPVSGDTAGTSAPYTVTQSGVEYDNSASRLNVAKAAIKEVLQEYSGNTDFGLADYKVSSKSVYNTWVYYMSGSGGFQFATSKPSSGTWVPNPCYNNSDADCKAIQSYYGSGSGASTDNYMIISQTSDAPSINDVLYAGSGLPDRFIVHDGPSPSSPWPPNYSLSDYESGKVSLSYNDVTDMSGGFAMGPTNAGYVPYSPQVYFAKRGFGYDDSGVSATGAQLLVGISSAGTHPTQSDINSYVQQFVPYLKPETNDTSSQAISAGAPQSPLAGLLNYADNYYTGSNAPATSSGCPAKRYVVLVTDGLPTEDLDGNAWPPLGSAAAKNYGVTASFNSDGSLASTNDQALQDAIAKIQALKQAGVKTYVVGLGAGVDPSRNPQAAATLKAMAVAGGTGDYFPATSPSAVASDLQAILAQVEAATETTSSAAINSTGLRTDTTVYQAQFDSQDLYGDWTGNLLAYPINSNGTVQNTTSAAKWQAQAQLDSQNWDTGRAIATWDASSAAGVPFHWSDISSNEQGLLETSAGTTSITLCGGSTASSTAAQWGQARLQYLRGATCDEQRNGGPFRNRAHILGDIVHSNPLYVGAPRDFYGSSSYQAFQSQYANRTPVVYVGGDDGMLHAFDANNGKELFAYVPHGVFGNLYRLTEPTYNNSHQFFVDGSPNAGDVQFSDGSWHTILVGGENDGGDSIYALDVTDPGAMTTGSAVAGEVLWEYSDSDLGKTYSQPQIARIATGTNTTESVVIFGSGYNNGDGKPYLYVVDAQTGSLIRRIDLCAQVSAACDLTKANGLSTPAVISSSGSPIATTVYAGDLQGNLWRVDISSTNPTNWSATVLFHATDGSGNDQPITTKPAVTLQPNYPRLKGTLVFFGTGRFLGSNDLTTTGTQSFYGLWDKGSGATISRSNLVQQTLTTTSATTFNGTNQVRTVSHNAVDWTKTGVSGWYMNLPVAGERVVTRPRLDSGRVIFTTYVPDASSGGSCSAGGSSYLMALNYANGSSFPLPELDLNGDGQLNSNDQVNGENPVGLSMGAGLATAPSLLRTRQGDIGDVKLVTRSGGQITTVKERGTSSHSGSWRQLH